MNLDGLYDLFWPIVTLYDFWFLCPELNRPCMVLLLQSCWLQSQILASILEDKKSCGPEFCPFGSSSWDSRHVSKPSWDQPNLAQISRTYPQLAVEFQVITISYYFKPLSFKVLFYVTAEFLSFMKWITCLEVIKSDLVWIYIWH